MSPDLLAVWGLALEELTDERIRAGFEHHLKTSTYEPKPMDILEAAKVAKSRTQQSSFGGDNSAFPLVRHAKPYDPGVDGDYDDWQEREWGQKKYRAIEMDRNGKVVAEKLVRNPYARPSYKRADGRVVFLIEADEDIRPRASN